MGDQEMEREAMIWNIKKPKRQNENSRNFTYKCNGLTCSLDPS